MLRSWYVALMLCCAAVIFSAHFCDRAIADAVHQLGPLRDNFKSKLLQIPILQGGGVALLLWGALSAGKHEGVRQARTALQAGLAMVSAMIINIVLLKPFFGRAVPWMYLARGAYGFHPFTRGTLYGAFPSGHAALAGALVCVLWREYPKGRPAYLSASAILFGTLVLGEWHFVSDLIAGGFLGVGVGFLVIAATAALAQRPPAPALHFMDSDVTRWFDWVTKQGGARVKKREKVPNLIR